MHIEHQGELLGDAMWTMVHLKLDMCLVIINDVLKSIMKIEPISTTLISEDDGSGFSALLVACPISNELL